LWVDRDGDRLARRCGCGLKAWAVPEASPKPTSPRLPDRRALPAIFLMLSVVIMDFSFVVVAPW
jgi:hypothetical protein